MGIARNHVWLGAIGGTRSRNTGYGAHLAAPQPARHPAEESPQQPLRRGHRPEHQGTGLHPRVRE
eukprot:15472841-Alexandrium_andersonii.AAC.1